MLNSITYTTLLDDVSHEDPTTNQLETTLASLLGQQSATLTSSGTMGNQLSARVHLMQPPYSILADARSHILGYEAGGVASLSGALPIPVHPAPGKEYITLEDVKEKAVLSDNEHFAPTKLVCLENTIHGAIIPFDECQRICSWAHENGIKTHLDGARLWEVAASQVAEDSTVKPDGVRAALEARMHAYGSLFDSVTVCFSKGLGAPIGSILAGSHSFIAQARRVRKSLGGGMRMTGLIAAPAAVAVEETFFGGQLVRSHEVARRVGKMWEERGGSLIRKVETNMVWIDLSAAGRAEIWENEAKVEGLEVYGGRAGRIVCHYQICEEAVQRLGRVFDKVIKGETSAASKANGLHSAAITAKGGFGGYGGAESTNGTKRKVSDAALDGDEGH